MNKMDRKYLTYSPKGKALRITEFDDKHEVIISIQDWKYYTKKGWVKVDEVK
jgi:hypothetical protein